MPRGTSVPGAVTASGFSLWRIALWLILLLATLGCLLYVRDVQQPWVQWQTLSPGDSDGASKLRGIVGWDVGYLLVALAMGIFSAGGILRQAWARPTLRVASVLLAVYFLCSGAFQVQTFNGLSHSLAQVQAQPQAPEIVELQAMLQHLLRSFELAFAMESVAIFMLLWLAWQLGKPAVRSQFRSRIR
jgi:hypothetical protein